MEIIIASTAGFCFGVERAINRINDLEKNKSCKDIIYTLGPIIHNPTVVNELKEHNIFAVDFETALSLNEGTIVIRSHGVSKDIYNQLAKKKLNIIDTTCPYVKNVHKKISYLEKKGYHILIIGKKDHPEVEGIIGQCIKEPIVVNDVKEIQNRNIPNKIGIVAQTTILKRQFKEIINEIINQSKEILVFNTICSATEERQIEAASLSKSLEAMIVIGGKSSSNTNKLNQICKENCSHVFFIEEVDELDLKKIGKFNKIGITAGASTPSQSIDRVIKTLKKEFNASIQTNQRKEKAYE